MRVDVFTVDCDGSGERLEAQGGTLLSCFPDAHRDPEYKLVRDQLVGRHSVAFVGGGAAPLFKIVRVY